MGELAKAPQLSPPFYVTKTAKMVENQNGWARWIRNCSGFPTVPLFSL